MQGENDNIDRKLGSAGAVLVVWSAASRGSEYVRSEAATGLYKNKLIQVRIDKAHPPRPFDQVEVPLTEDDVEALKESLMMPGWRVLMRLLDGKVEAMSRAAHGLGMTNPLDPAIQTNYLYAKAGADIRNSLTREVMRITNREAQQNDSNFTETDRKLGMLEGAAPALQSDDAPRFPAVSKYRR